MSGTERTGWKVRANYYTGWRAVGGRLSWGEGRLVFEPHAVDRILGGRRFETSVDDIVSIEVARRGAVPRERLFVHTRDGVESAFLVPGVGQRAAELRTAIGGQGG